MSEEENEATEILKEVASDDFDTLGDDISPKMAQNILNIINNQQKEIKELKSIASEFTNRNIEQFSIGEFDFKVKHFKDNYIHKDKIKELKEKVEKEMISNPYDFSYMINELLEENTND